MENTGHPFFCIIVHVYNTSLAVITLSYLVTINCKFKFENIVSENKNARLIKGKNQPSSGNMKNKVVLHGQKNVEIEDV